MKIVNEFDEILNDPDLRHGFLTEKSVFVCHHEAVEAVEEESHYEVVQEYPNGGRDVVKVIDVPAVAACEAYDEYETVYVYHPTEDADEPSQLDRIEAQVFYTAMMTDTLMEGT